MLNAPDYLDSNCSFNYALIFSEDQKHFKRKNYLIVCSQRIPKYVSFYESAVPVVLSSQPLFEKLLDRWGNYSAECLNMQAVHADRWKITV